MLITNIDRPSRRTVSRLLLGLAGASMLGQFNRAVAGTAPDRVDVWKTPSCGCCGEWVSHLRRNGFEVAIHDVKDTAPMRQQLGLPEKFGSCHTGVVGAYVLEGHVPASEIRRLLREKPQALGLAVPGMPVGSPGMEMGNDRQAFDVLLVQKDGRSRVYQTYPVKSSSFKS